MNTRHLNHHSKKASHKTFTLLEVVIAIVILAVGMTSVIAVFPTALKQASATFRDSYSAIITQSVIDAINVGIRESRYQEPSSEGWEYFIFAHDGVTDDLYGDSAHVPEDYTTISDKDFCILMPRGPNNNSNSANEIVMSYPTPTYKAHVGRRAVPKIAQLPRLDCSGPDFRFELLSGTGPYAGGKDVAITRVYRLGRLDNLAGVTGTNPSNFIREEYLGDEFDGERVIADPYPQYSFAFTFQRARLDTGRPGNANKPDGALTSHDRFSDSLFDVRILVFRNFQDLDWDQNPKVPPTNMPLLETATLVSK